MRRSLFFISSLVLAAVLFLASSPAAAITYGQVDTTNAYSNVGAFIVQSPDGLRIFPLCSGTLIAPTVFLTASHCTSYFTNVLSRRA